MQAATPPIPKQSIGTTFVAAISILGAMALLQLIAVAVILTQRVMDRNASPAPAAQADPAAALPLPPPAAATPSGAAPRAAAESERLLQQARIRENQQDYEAAVDFLTRADEVNPDSPEILARLASLNEKLGQNEDAAAYWQRILELGPLASTYRKQAERQLGLLGRPSTGLPAATALQSGLRDDVGLQPGAMLGIVDCRISDPDSKNRMFRIAVKSRPGVPIDIRDVKFQVLIYEKEEGDVVLTRANLLSDWLSKPIDWQDDNIEILQVSYPVPSAAPTADGALPRTYFGYMVQVYYKDQLQDFRTEPGSIREMFPPKVSLSEQAVE